MFVAELFEAPASTLKKLVIIPGGFHPFHPGHFSLYRAAQTAFPDADIYYASTNDKSQRPFDFADKARLAEIAGVPPGHFVQVKSPFQAQEITQHYDPNTTAVIFARSEKDRGEPPVAGGIKKDGSASYLQPIAKNLKPMSQHGYMAYLPTIKFAGNATSATEIRQAWSKASKPQKTAWAQELYPNSPVEAKQILDKYLAVKETASGVIASKTQAHDPRYSMSLSQDVRPGAIDRNLKKLHLEAHNPTVDAMVHLIKLYRDDIDYYQGLIADPKINANSKLHYKKKIKELQQKIHDVYTR